MAKIISELPPGFAFDQTTAQKPPSGPPKATPASTKGDGRVKGPKALERPNSGQRMNEYSEWMMRRCDAFGIASSRYFKKNQTCPKPKRET